MTAIPDNRTADRAHAGRVTIAALSIVATSLALLVAACGSQAPPAQIGGDTVPATLSPTTTTTEPPETTTTIDFDLPVDQLTTPLEEATTVAEVGEVIDDMRGLTADLTAQMSRLGQFVPLATVSRARILDVAVTADAVPERGVRVVSMVVANVESEASSVASVIDDELRATGWNRAIRTDESGNGSISIETVYRVPGTSGDEIELLVGVEGGRGPTVLRLRYHAEDEANALVLDRLRAWQRDLPVPAGTVVVGASITTVDDRAVLSVRYHTAAETPAEARALMAGRFPRSGYDFDLGHDSTEGGIEPLLLVDEEGTQLRIEFDPTSESDKIELTASTELELTPLG